MDSDIYSAMKEIFKSGEISFLQISVCFVFKIYFFALNNFKILKTYDYG